MQNTHYDDKNKDFLLFKSSLPLCFLQQFVNPALSSKKRISFFVLLVIFIQSFCLIFRCLCKILFSFPNFVSNRNCTKIKNCHDLIISVRVPPPVKILHSSIILSVRFKTTSLFSLNFLPNFNDDKLLLLAYNDTIFHLYAKSCCFLGNFSNIATKNKDLLQEESLHQKKHLLDTLF